MNKAQATTNSKLEDLTGLAAEVSGVKEYMKSLPKVENYEALKKEVKDQIQEVPSAASYEEFKAEVKQQIQGLPTAADSAELKETVRALQRKAENNTEGEAQKGGANAEEIIAESSERQKRAKNIIMIGVKESTHESAPGRKEEDLRRLREILGPMGVNTDGITTLRLGKKVEGPTRLLKVIFPSMTAAKAALVESKKLPADRRMRNDMTPKQRTYLNSMRAELAKRQEETEKELTIRFIHDKPVIVEKTKEARQRRRPRGEDTAEPKNLSEPLLGYSYYTRTWHRSWQSRTNSWRQRRKQNRISLTRYRWMLLMQRQ